MKRHGTEWIEIITLRAPGKDLEALAAQVIESVAGSTRDDGQVQVRTYRNPTLPTDLSVHLHLRSDDPARGREIGRRLALALEDHGLVDRSVWVEVARSPERREP